MFGKTTRRKVVRARRAPSERAASSISRVELEQHRLHRADDERQRHEEQREHDRRPGEGDVDRRSGELRAVEREQRQAGDDRRQRERQVDERVHDALPRKSSRTSTQAMIVPNTALTSADGERDDERQLQGRDGLRGRDDVPEAGAAVAARLPQTSAAIGSDDDQVR